MTGFVFEMLQNIGKGENAGYQHFILFQQYFQNAFSPGSLNGIVWKMLLTELLMKYIGHKSNHERHIILVTEIIIQFIPRSLSIRKELFDM